ncbi:unnamed protein product, partial [marine sediment metagenome]
MTLGKVNGKAIDDIAKINGVVVIGLGDALVGEVKDGKFFYAGSTTLLEGTMPTQTLNPANENVLAGYYAATTLSAVDAHLVAENIKKGVNIFGKVGTVDDFASAIAQGWLDGMGATVEDFQANPATGTFYLPEQLNDNDTGDCTYGDSINEYAEVD